MFRLISGQIPCFLFAFGVASLLGRGQGVDFIYIFTMGSFY